MRGQRENQRRWIVWICFGVAGRILAQNSRQIGTYRLDCDSASTGTAIDITRGRTEEPPTRLECHLLKARNDTERAFEELRD